MKKIVCGISILIWSSVFSLDSYSQKINHEDSIRYKNKWEIGTNLSWLLKIKKIPSTNILFRYNFDPSRKFQKGLRIHSGLSFNTYDSLQINNLQPYHAKEIKTYIAIGIEWQKKIANEVIINKGIDFAYAYNRNKSTKEFYPGPNLYQDLNKDYTYGTNLFIGVRYFPTNWLSLSIENDLAFSYRIRRDKFKTTSVAFPDSPGLQGEYNVKSFQIKIVPFSTLGLNLYLNKL